ncbi:MAG: hypothetical protein JO339_31630 [Alphaproteobacteria bacterium]|nr:hypothetical protein [Alphaproteobacteria bacterium]
MIAAFVAGFALVAGAFGILITQAGLFDHDTPISKPRKAAEQRANVVFVGPSHVATGVIPEVFDEELSRFVKVQSYNMAIAGLTIPETEAALARLFAMKPCCVTYVIFYPGFMMTDVARVPTTRSVEFFTLPRALQFWSFLSEYKPPPDLSQVDFAKNIIIATFQHYTNLGLGLPLLGVVETWYDRPQPALGDRWSARGHIAIDRAVPDGEAKTWWLDEISKLKAAGPQFQAPIISDRLFANVERIITLINAHGARAIVVRPPSLARWGYDVAFVRKYEQACSDGPPLLDFNPDAYPTLYEGRNHYDGAHLNVRGAEIWSRILADEVGELIRSGRLDHPSVCRAAGQ